MLNTRITLDKIQVCNFASEETTCFKAHVLFDGVKIGEARNDGHGGATVTYVDIYKGNQHAAAEHYAAQVLDGAGFDPPLSQLVDALIELHQVQREVTTRYRRISKAKVVYIKDGELYNFALRNGNATMAELIGRVVAKHPTAEILNTLPEAQAVARYVAVVMGTPS